MSRVYIVADVGSPKTLDIAYRLLEAAAKAGADAAKTQTYRAHLTMHPSHPSYELLKAHEMPLEWLPKLKAHADSLGIDYSSTPDDLSVMYRLDELGCPFIKIASMNATYHRLIRAAAATGRRLIISTGMADDHALRIAEWHALDAGAKEIIWLYCVSRYPARIWHYDMKRLNCMLISRENVGLSDHTLSIELPATAVSLGASMIEKHLTLNRSAGGPDDTHSLEPQEFKRMVGNVRRTQEWQEQEHQVKRDGARGLYWRHNLDIGHKVNYDDVIELVPPTSGFNAENIEKVLGITLTKAVTAYMPVMPLEVSG